MQNITGRKGTGIPLYTQFRMGGTETWLEDPQAAVHPVSYPCTLARYAVFTTRLLPAPVHTSVAKLSDLSIMKHGCASAVEVQWGMVTALICSLPYLLPVMFRSSGSGEGSTTWGVRATTASNAAAIPREPKCGCNPVQASRLVSSSVMRGDTLRERKVA